jgi:hypothetical protein
MKYQAPYGSPSGPNDEAVQFINGNPTAGIKGSIIPAGGIEYATDQRRLCLYRQFGSGALE